MNAQKFTQKSLETIQLANNLALENNNMQIEQEHLLYALLKIDQSLIALDIIGCCLRLSSIIRCS